VPSGPSLCSIKRVREDDLGRSLQSGGITLWGQKDSGSAAETFLLAETSTGCRQVYRPLRNMACNPLCLLLTSRGNPYQYTTCQASHPPRGEMTVFL
jgi:hypothetical protein